MVFVYQLAVLFYYWGIKLYALINLKAKLFIKGRVGLLNEIKGHLAANIQPKIWVHCSSVGEFEQASTLLESFKTEFPNKVIALTFFSPSGYQACKNTTLADYVFYLPIDTYSNAQLFVQYINPSLAVFVKYDLWYCYIRVLKSKKIPIILISAIFRNTQIYFKWYGKLHRQMLSLIDYIYVQNETSKNLLSKINIDRVEIMGDTRFDRVYQTYLNVQPLEGFEKLKQSNNLLIAGSTWFNDELLLKEWCTCLPKGWKLIVVPHEINTQRIQDIITLFDNKVVLWSAWDRQQFSESVLIVDTMGILKSLYQYATLAWIGGGLDVRNGVHNVLEAAVFGVPCAYGPYYKKYQEAISLIEVKGARCCSNASELKSYVDLLLGEDVFFKNSKKAAQNYVCQNIGTTLKIISHIKEHKFI